VRAKLNYGTTLAALICLLSLMGRDASAITAEVARKCGALTDKAYPLRVPGNPAAGRTHGTVRDVRNYFNKCVANGGEMEGQAPK
jgi:predicted alpha/beta-hydrolase family hydrolase